MTEIPFNPEQFILPHLKPEIPREKSGIVWNTEKQRNELRINYSTSEQFQAVVARAEKVKELRELFFTGDNGERDRINTAFALSPIVRRYNCRGYHPV